MTVKDGTTGQDILDLENSYANVAFGADDLFVVDPSLWSQVTDINKGEFDNLVEISCTSATFVCNIPSDLTSLAAFVGQHNPFVGINLQINPGYGKLNLGFSVTYDTNIQVGYAGVAPVDTSSPYALGDTVTVLSDIYPNGIHMSMLNADGSVRATYDHTDTSNSETYVNQFTVVDRQLDGKVWCDSNENGKIDSGERGVGATVKMQRLGSDGITWTDATDSSGTALKTTTDSSGNYKFDGILLGRYRVLAVINNGQARPIKLKSSTLPAEVTTTTGTQGSYDNDADATTVMADAGRHGHRLSRPARHRQQPLPQHGRLRQVLPGWQHLPRLPEQRRLHGRLLPGVRAPHEDEPARQGDDASGHAVLDTDVLGKVVADVECDEEGHHRYGAACGDGDECGQRVITYGRGLEEGDPGRDGEVRHKREHRSDDQ